MKNHSINVFVLSFETIVAGFDFTCGLLSNDGYVICWGIGWVHPTSASFKDQLLPEPCFSCDCDCGINPQSQNFATTGGQYVVGAIQDLSLHM